MCVFEQKANLHTNNLKIATVYEVTNHTDIINMIPRDANKSKEVNKKFQASSLVVWALYEI